MMVMKFRFHNSRGFVKKQNRYKMFREDTTENFVNYVTEKSRDSSVGVALGYGCMIGVLGFDSQRGLGIFLFTTASRTALGPTQPLSNGY
jgi:hypothetical protein